MREGLAELVQFGKLAYTIRKVNIKKLRPYHRLKEESKKSRNDEEDKVHATYSENCFNEAEKEKVEIKLINSIINLALSKHKDFQDHQLMPELEKIFSGEIEFLLPTNNYDTVAEVAEIKASKDMYHESEMVNNASELKRLQYLATH